jgi:hypothetical protein
MITRSKRVAEMSENASPGSKKYEDAEKVDDYFIGLFKLAAELASERKNRADAADEFIKKDGPHT